MLLLIFEKEKSWRVLNIVGVTTPRRPQRDLMRLARERRVQHKQLQDDRIFGTETLGMVENLAEAAVAKI